ETSKAAPQPQLSHGEFSPLQPLTRAEKPLSEIERRMKQRLVRGSESLDARLDLHGKTQAEAHRALLAFLRRAQRSGARIVLVIFSPDRSGALNEISSRMRSITVCSRRAPIFSMLVLTRTATSAMASTASGVNSSETPSVCISATYCLINEASVSVRIRRKSS